jgi:hypothetical protein
MQEEHRRPAVVRPEVEGSGAGRVERERHGSGDGDSAGRTGKATKHGVRRRLLLAVHSLARARYTATTMSDSPKPPEIQLQIQLDDDVANGRYVNMALVNHTETEFTLDFIYVQPQQPRAKVLSRIITNPKHMKRLLLAIQENLAKYEQKFGPVEIIDPGTPVH